MSDRQRPFSNGSEFTWWDNANCNQCAKAPSYDEETGCYRQDGRCDILTALSAAMFDDGSVSGEIATRMGYSARAYTAKGERYTHWDCPEKEPIRREIPGEVGV